MPAGSRMIQPGKIGKPELFFEGRYREEEPVTPLWVHSLRLSVHNYFGGRTLRIVVACLLALFAAACIVNTVFNNSQYYGATLHDSTIWPVLMWHNGPALKMAGALGDASFYQTHVSPIHYLPTLLSYVFPWDWLHYYALVYAVAFAALIVIAWRLMAGDRTRVSTTLLAGLGALLLFISQSVFFGAWEMHMEFFSPPLALLMFWSWQQRRYRAALAWMLLNATVREDIAAITGVTLTLLVAAQYLAARRTDIMLARERLRWGCILVGIALLYTIAVFAIQKMFFHPFVIDMLYFPKDDPFGHITRELLAQRALTIFHERAGLWLPMLALVAGALVLRDPQLLAAPLGIIPYWFIFFIAKFEGGAIMDTYRPFPFVVLMLWPALMAINQHWSHRRRYMLLQAGVLLAGLAYVKNDFLRTMEGRWWPQPTAWHTAEYDTFGAHQLPLLLAAGGVRASHGVLARYPWQFQPWYLSDVTDLKPAEADAVKILLWFENDRDQTLVNALLAQHSYEFFTIDGTKLHMAWRKETFNRELMLKLQGWEALHSVPLPLSAVPQQLVAKVVLPEESKVWPLLRE
jgi:hypothetical protein